MKIIKIMSADNWFYVWKDDDKTYLYRLAEGALVEPGNIVGMISIEDTLRKNPENNGARLVAVPPTNGLYKHMDELNAQEKNFLLEEKGELKLSLNRL